MSDRRGAIFVVCLKMCKDRDRAALASGNSGRYLDPDSRSGMRWGLETKVLLRISTRSDREASKRSRPDGLGIAGSALWGAAPGSVSYVVNVKCLVASSRGGGTLIVF